MSTTHASSSAFASLLLLAATLGCTADTSEKSSGALGTDVCPHEPPGTDAGAHDHGHDAGVPPVTPDAGEPPETHDACTFTQGYYKNHPEDWPVASLTVAGQVYGRAELLELYRTGVRGDLSIALAHQLVTAMLNVANGAPAPAVLAEADLFLMAHTDVDGRLPFGYVGGTAIHVEASRLNDLLTAFNEGRAGTRHCT